MSFPHNALEARLHEARTDDDLLRTWLQDLRRTTVFVPLRVTGQTRSLAVMQVDGHQLVPLFTSPEMLQAATQAPSFAPPFAGLLDLLPGGVGMIVNPGSDVSVTITADDLSLVRTSGVPEPVGASRMYIGDPADEPVELLAALSRTARGIAAVRELRRAWVSVDGAAPGLVVGVDIDPDNDDVRLVVLDTLRRATPADSVVDLVFANDRGAVIEWMWANTETFYVDE